MVGVVVGAHHHQRCHFNHRHNRTSTANSITAIIAIIAITTLTTLTTLTTFTTLTASRVAPYNGAGSTDIRGRRGGGGG